MLEDTREKLEEWARWVRAGGYSIGYQGVNLGLGSTVSTPMITDDDAMAIDSAVARLKHREPILASVLMLYYVRKWSHAVISRELGNGESREKVRQYLNSAEAWIDGVLCDR
jgi:hypothetical protein